MRKDQINIALLGNPNAGKSSLFNHLTGLNQKVGNFPGVTVDKKVGFCTLPDNSVARIIDLPGTYSIYPRSIDERVVFDILNNPASEDYPDVLVVIIDASNLRRNLLLFTQLKDFGFPVILALNMMDVAERHGLKIDVEGLSEDFGTKVFPLNGRKGEGLDQLKAAMVNPGHVAGDTFVDLKSLSGNLITKVRTSLNIDNDYRALQLAHHHLDLKELSSEQKGKLAQICAEENFESNTAQAKETIARYKEINLIYSKNVAEPEVEDTITFSSKIDKILTHKVWGYVIFFVVMMLIFQAVFAWASYPMELIDQGVASLNAFLQEKLPAGALTNLLTEGLIAGLGGVLIFIPQIAVLFAFIAILEESGYMARVMFIMDKIMRQFGLNGKSIVPLVSSVACAVPAIMAARSIDNWKDRLITIFVAPLISCSARIPVFTILIALVVPPTYIWGVFNLQALTLMGLYILGFLTAIASAWVMKLIIKTKEKSYFILELPGYKVPRWKNVGLTIIEKVKTFVFEAGKVIMAISIVLWVLASYGPGNSMDEVEKSVEKVKVEKQLTEEEADNLLASGKLEASYAGHFGHFIEPVIKPLGFDWKIGIALVTSFAAREVFVGTMSTIYSIGTAADEEATVVNRMRAEINPETGGPMYTPALGFSLMVFYLFAMQCMSTLAVTYRETKGLKWPMLQLVYMTGLAYAASFVVYHLF